MMVVEWKSGTYLTIGSRFSVDRGEGRDHLELHSSHSETFGFFVCACVYERFIHNFEECSEYKL